MEITLGPVLYDWPRERLLSFYEEVLDMAVDTVYLGEVVCAKRTGLSVSDIESIGRRFEEAGKKIFLSTPAVVSNEKELDYIRALAALPFDIEANDISAIAISGEKVKGAGPHITTYNAEDINYLKGLGIERLTFPVELPRDSVVFNIKETGLFGEIFAHGRVPLAFSWRCYTSRIHGRTKDECAHDCLKYPEGLLLRNVDDIPVFTINGTSILSADTYTLVGSMEDLAEIGVKAVRISPDPENTGDVVKIFRDRINGKLDAKEGINAIKELTGGGLCNGWYAGSAGKDFKDIIGEAEALVI